MSKDVWINLWNEVEKRHLSKRVDNRYEEGIIYKQIKLTKNRDTGEFKLLRTNETYYPRMPEPYRGVFLFKGLDAGLEKYKEDEHIIRYPNCESAIKKLEKNEAVR